MAKIKKQNVRRIKSKTPVSIIIYGGNNVGKVLAQTLLQEQSKVILIDNYSKNVKDLILHLKEFGDIDFVDVSGLEDLLRKINRIDYIFYNHNQFLLQKKSFSSQDFLQQSNYLNYTLKAATKFGASFTLLSTIKYNKLLLEDKRNPKINQEYSPQELQKYAETLVAEYHDQSKLNARVIRLGTILGEVNDIQYYPKVYSLFLDAATKDVITIKGEGLETHYFIHIKDALFGILKLTFSDTTKGSVISLCNDKDYTEIAMAYKLLELNPKATEIKFEPTNENKKIIYEKYIPATNAKNFGWTQSVSIAQAFQDTLKQVYAQYNKKWEPPKIHDKPKKINQTTQVKEVKTFLGKIVDKIGSIFYKPKKAEKKQVSRATRIRQFLNIIIFITVFYFFIGPIISTGWSSYKIYKTTTKLKQDFFVNSINTNRIEILEIKRHTNIIKNNLNTLHWIFKITKQEDLYQNLQYLVYIGETSSDSADILVQGLNPLFEYMNNFEPSIQIIDGEPTSIKEYTEYLKAIEANNSMIIDGINKLESASYTIDLLNPEVFPSKIKDYIIDLKILNNQYGRKLPVFANLMPEIPDLLGLHERKIYVVLLQNQTEIRSTGGWISAYAIIGLEHGQIREFEVGDVYDIDGQIKLLGEKIDPPKDMEEDINVHNWTLSLANWDPELYKTKNAVQFFLNRADKTYKVDGLLTVDLVFIEELLQQWNGITIPGDVNPITKDNLYNKLFAIHQSFSPGNSQKSTFLTSLTSEIFKKILSDKQNELSRNILPLTIKALNTKHLMIYINNPNVETYFAQQQWSGELLNKYFSLPFDINWNWGANKANYYIDTTKNIDINIKDINNITYSYTINMQNRSSTEIYPQGTYKDFMRIYLPKNVNIESVTGFKDDVYTIDTKKNPEYTVLKGWVEVPILSTKSINIKYAINKDTSPATYPLKSYGKTRVLEATVFKHPGFNMIPYTINVSYPLNWTISDENIWTTANNTATLHLEVDTDTDISISWVENN